MAKSKTESKKEQVVIELTLAEVVTEFYPAVTQLGSCAIKNTDITWSLAVARRQAKQHVQDFNEARKQLAESSCLKDTDGKPVIEDQKYQYPNDKTEREANDLILELEKKKVKIEVKQFKVSVLRNVEGVTGNALMACGDMFIEG